MKKDMKVIEGESVARQVHRNREWTQIDANLELGRLTAPKSWNAEIGFRSALKEGYREGDVRRDANHGGRFVSAALQPTKCGWAANFRKSLIFNLDLM
jgi:hypothetical protein